MESPLEACFLLKWSWKHSSLTPTCYLSTLLEAALFLMEWHLVFPSDGQLCIWRSPVKAFTKQSPLENSISDNQVVEKKSQD